MITEPVAVLEIDNSVGNTQIEGHRHDHDLGRRTVQLHRQPATDQLSDHCWWSERGPPEARVHAVVVRCPLRHCDDF